LNLITFLLGKNQPCFFMRFIHEVSLKYLGFEITGDGYSDTDEKVRAICDFLY